VSSTPSSITLTINLPDDMPAERAMNLRDNLIGLLQGTTDFSTLDYEADVWWVVETARDETPCHWVDPRLGPLTLDSGATWACQREQGHDDPEGKGGHYLGWTH